MLENNDRLNFTDIFEPPEGFVLEHVWGTSYSVSLNAFIMVLLAMENCGNVPEIERKQTISRAQLLMIFERNLPKITLLAQQGLIYFDSKFPPEFQAQMWKSIRQQIPKENGSFHPKIWLIAFRNAKKEYKFRLLVTSRNLTQDTDFDAAVVFETNEEGQPGEKNNEEIIKILGDALTDDWRTELRKHYFPEGIFDVPVFPDNVHTVISPFLDKDSSSDNMVGKLKEKGLINLFSTRKDIANLDSKTREGINFFELRPMNTSETSDEDSVHDDEEMNKHYGLHAKLYFSKKYLYLGSRNCTYRGWNKNVEFMVKLENKISAQELCDALVYDPNGTEKQKKKQKNALFQPCDVKNLKKEESEQEKEKTNLIEFLKTVDPVASYDEKGSLTLEKLPKKEGLKIRPLLAGEEKEWTEGNIVWNNFDKRKLSPYFLVSFKDLEMSLFAKINDKSKEYFKEDYAHLCPLSLDETLEYLASCEIPLGDLHFITADSDESEGNSSSRKKSRESRRYLERLLQGIVADNSIVEKKLEFLKKKIDEIEKKTDKQDKRQLPELKALKCVLEKMKENEDV